MQWAKRLTGASILLLLIGVVSYYNAMPSMFEELDPAQSNMLELEPGDSGEGEIAALGEYVALRMEGDESYHNPPSTEFMLLAKGDCTNSNGNNYIWSRIEASRDTGATYGLNIYSGNSTILVLDNRRWRAGSTGFKKF